MITPRENMLKILRGEKAEWIPAVLYLDPFNHPDVESMPSELREKFRKDIRNWSKSGELTLALSEYLGVEEYIVNVPSPIEITLNEAEVKDYNDGTSIIAVKSGDLFQKREACAGGSLITKRYVKEYEDIARLMRHRILR